MYAGSLVNPGHLKRCKPDCECRDSAAMNLGEQVAAMSEAALAGKRVVRLHTGDPAMYGAINEQIRALAEKGLSLIHITAERPADAGWSLSTACAMAWAG